MSWVPAEQVLATVANQREVIASEQSRISTFTQYHATERAKLVGEHAQAVHDLGQALLVKLDAASIAAAAQTVGLVGLPNENVPGRVEARRAWLATRLTEILHDPRYAQRELLRHPRTGSLPRAIAEAEEYRKPVSGVLAECAEHPRFERLWETGFGTPEHQGAWWRYSHWQDRSAAQELVARFPGKTTFAEVREEVQRARETVATYDDELARLRGEIAAGEALEREYATLYDEHLNLDARGLEHTRQRIVQHLLTSDASLVAQRLRQVPALLLLFLRSSGLTAKIAYLDGVQRTNLFEMQNELATQQERLDGVETRTRRRWAPMPLDKFQKLSEDRRPRYEKRWQRFGKVYTSVHSYDRWDRGRYYQDILWWDLMTRGRYDGSYLPEVAVFHQRHPDYSFDPDWKAHAASHESDRDPADAADDVSGGGDAEAAAAATFADSSADAQPDVTATDAS